MVGCPGMLSQESQNLLVLLLEQHSQDLSSELVMILKFVTESVLPSVVELLQNMPSCKDQLVMKTMSRRSLLLQVKVGNVHARWARTMLLCWWNNKTSSLLSPRVLFHSSFNHNVAVGNQVSLDSLAEKQEKKALILTQPGKIRKKPLFFRISPR